MPSRFSLIKLCVGLTLTLLAGVGIGWSAHASPDTPPTVATIREPEGKYRFINPLIGCTSGEKNEFTEYFAFEKKLQDSIARLKQAGKISSASVYFRDMESGRWTGVNEEELYSPASLYKVALMIAVLRKSEDDPKLLDEEITFTGNRSPDVPDHPPMNIGKAYRIRELLERLIILSDNDAKDLLRDKVGMETASTVFTDLRLNEPDLNETGDSMSARTYSRFFRALYNATYLNRSDSEYALNLLSKVEFKSGIVNGLPSDARLLPIAHKFGYRTFPDPLDTVTEEIHDCGIVYVPDHPYFVCIMTKGSKQTDLLDSIQILSGLVYHETARR